MAVVYFTSNASTGAGSLAEAIANAQPGDVVRPDETVFERGSTIEIALASTLMIDKNLTLDASPFRVRLDGGGSVACAAVANGATVAFSVFDFIGGATSQNGGGLNVGTDATVVLNRCRVCGCDAAQYGGGIYVGDNATLTANDSAIFGNRAQFGGGVYVGDDAEATFNGATVCGNVDANAGLDIDGETSTSALASVNSILGNAFDDSETSGSVVDVASSTIGFVASPPGDLAVDNWSADAWQSWDLRLLDDASGAPSPYRDSGDVGAMSRYDLDGNFRGRETDGASTCSPGAYETLQADLFWVGVDATGATVETPSFLTSDGWAASRFATVSGDVAPQVGQTLFIGRDVAFNAPPSGRIGALTVGGGTVLKFGGGTTTVSDLVAGIGVVLQGSPITGNRARLGDYFRAETSVFYSFALTEVGASVYIGNHAAYATVVSTAPTYGILQLLPSSSRCPTLSGNYVCADFRVRVNSNVNVLPVAVSGSATVRSTLFSLGTDATSQYFERFFDGPVTLKLQGDATVGVPSPTRETWADNFTVDVSEATSATLTLSGQTVYGDAPTAAVALTGSAKIAKRGLDVASLTLNNGATLTVDGGSVCVAELSVADGANVAFSGVDAVLSTTESSTVGTATFIGTGYFATPPDTDTSSASFAETVRNCDYGANVSSFSASPNTATAALLSWVKQNPTPSVLIEEANGSAWNVVNNRATGDSLSVNISAPKTFRLFDGENFFTTSVRPYGTAYELAEEQTIGYLKTLISTGYLN